MASLARVSAQPIDTGGGWVGTLLPFVIAALCILIDGDRTAALTAWGFSTLGSELAFAMLAGNAIAGERTDRSAEFIACLPLSRWRLLAGKLLLFLIAIAMIWGVRLLIWNIWSFDQTPDLRSFPIQFLLIVGASWLFSSLNSSAVIASALGIVVNWVVVGCSAGVAYSKVMEELRPAHNIQEEFIPPFFTFYCVIGMPLAIACFSIGTWNYLRRRDL